MSAHNLVLVLIIQYQSRLLTQRHNAILNNGQFGHKGNVDI